MKRKFKSILILVVIATFLGSITIISFLSPSLAQSWEGWSHFHSLSAETFLLRQGDTIRAEIYIDDKDQVVFQLRDGTGDYYSGIKLIADKYGNPSIIDSQGRSLLPNIPRGLQPIEMIEPIEQPDLSTTIVEDGIREIQSYRADIDNLTFQVARLTKRINEISKRLNAITSGDQ